MIACLKSAIFLAVAFGVERVMLTDAASLRPLQNLPNSQISGEPQKHIEAEQNFRSAATDIGSSDDILVPSKRLLPPMNPMDQMALSMGQMNPMMTGIGMNQPMSQMDPMMGGMGMNPAMMAGQFQQMNPAAIAGQYGGQSQMMGGNPFVTPATPFMLLPPSQPFFSDVPERILRQEMAYSRWGNQFARLTAADGSGPYFYGPFTTFVRGF